MDYKNWKDNRREWFYMPPKPSPTEAVKVSQMDAAGKGFFWDQANDREKYLEALAFEERNFAHLRSPPAPDKTLRNIAQSTGSLAMAIKDSGFLNEIGAQVEARMKTWHFAAHDSDDDDSDGEHVRMIDDEDDEDIFPVYPRNDKKCVPKMVYYSKSCQDDEDDLSDDDEDDVAPVNTADVVALDVGFQSQDCMVEKILVNPADDNAAVSPPGAALLNAEHVVSVAPDLTASPTYQHLLTLGSYIHAQFCDSGDIAIMCSFAERNPGVIVFCYDPYIKSLFDGQQTPMGYRIGRGLLFVVTGYPPHSLHLFVGSLFGVHSSEEVTEENFLARSSGFSLVWKEAGIGDAYYYKLLELSNKNKKIYEYVTRHNWTCALRRASPCWSDYAGFNKIGDYSFTGDLLEGTGSVLEFVKDKQPADKEFRAVSICDEVPVSVSEGLALEEARSGILEVDTMADKSLCDDVFFSEGDNSVVNIAYVRKNTVLCYPAGREFTLTMEIPSGLQGMYVCLYNGGPVLVKSLFDTSYDAAVLRAHLLHLYTGMKQSQGAALKGLRGEDGSHVLCCARNNRDMTFCLVDFARLGAATHHVQPRYEGIRELVRTARHRNYYFTEKFSQSYPRPIATTHHRFNLLIERANYQKEGNSAWDHFLTRAAIEWRGYMRHHLVYASDGDVNDAVYEQRYERFKDMWGVNLYSGHEYDMAGIMAILSSYERGRRLVLEKILLILDNGPPVPGLSFMLNLWIADSLTILASYN